MQKTLRGDNISSGDQLHKSEDLGSELLVFWEKTQNSLFTNVVFALGSIDFELDFKEIRIKNTQFGLLSMK